MFNRRQLLAGSSFAAASFLPSLQPSAWAHATKTAYSLHIGVDKPNLAAYPGGINSLTGCVKDAEIYHSIAMRNGFQKSVMLKDSDATIERVGQHIYHAAAHLNAGDIFFVSYAGHGTQVTDTSGDETDDREDEAWCLYNGLLLDDYLYFLWSQFKQGVRLLVISDSCHSGSVARVINAARALNADLQAAPEVSKTRSILAEKDWTARGGGGDTAGFLSRLANDGKIENTSQDSGLRARTISPTQASAAYNGNRQEYARQQSVAARANNAVSVSAAGILLAGCQDNQVSWEASSSDPGGLFTKQLSTAINALAVSDSYSSLLDRITSRMPPGQVPNYFPFGIESPDFSLQKPFTL